MLLKEGGRDITCTGGDDLGCQEGLETGQEEEEGTEKEIRDSFPALGYVRLGWVMPRRQFSFR